MAIVSTSVVLRTEMFADRPAEPIEQYKAGEIAAYVEGVLNDFDEWYAEQLESLPQQPQEG